MKTPLFALVACGSAVCALAQETSTDVTAQGQKSTSAAAPANASAGNWLIGKWQFDPETTTKKQGENRRNVSNPELSTDVVASQILEKMKDASLVVTENEITMTRGDGSGKVNRYILIPTPDANVVQLKQENGETLSFHRDGDRIWTDSSNSLNQPLYFKKTP